MTQDTPAGGGPGGPQAKDCQLSLKPRGPGRAAGRVRQGSSRWTRSEGAGGTRWRGFEAGGRARPGWNAIRTIPPLGHCGLVITNALGALKPRWAARELSARDQQGA